MAKTAIPKQKPDKPSDETLVNEYMEKLEHPLKAEMQAVREIIKASSDKLSERIKWAAPSYYYKEDLVTFNHRNQEAVHLVFHHPAIVNIESALLEGDYKDRRMTYFKTMDEIIAKQSELQRILQLLLQITSP